jgi:DNA-binding transcriptional LysR family regulator
VQQLKRWPGIELLHLEALAVVSDEGSFRRAARKLGYTQSAISQQIAALERAVGHAVLERPSRGRPLALTEVGARLRRLHDTVEHAISAARADVAAAAAGVGHVVRVGTPFSFPHLSEAVVAMRVRHPPSSSKW